MKKSIGKIPLIYPLPIAIIGVKNDNGTFYTTVSNLSIMSINPAVIGIMLDQARYIEKQLDLKSRLSINIPSTLLIDKADLCASVSGEAFDKSTLFESKHIMNVPYIDECPVVLIAEVIDHTIIKKHHLYVCEIKKTLVEDSLFVDENIPSLNILDPIVYSLDDKYYRIGKVIGKARVEGKLLYDSLKKTMAPVPYSFHFKHKICQLKESGVSYKKLAKQFDVYHETIEDWYVLYTLYGRGGLTKKIANKLGSTKFTDEEKNQIVTRIIKGESTYRDMCEQYHISLSRLRNWVKKARKAQ